MIVYFVCGGLISSPFDGVCLQGDEALSGNDNSREELENEDKEQIRVTETCRASRRLVVHPPLLVDEGEQGLQYTVMTHC